MTEPILDASTLRFIRVAIRVAAVCGCLWMFAHAFGALIALL